MTSDETRSAVETTVDQLTLDESVMEPLIEFFQDLNYTSSTEPETVDEFFEVEQSMIDGVDDNLEDMGIANGFAQNSLLYWQIHGFNSAHREEVVNVLKGEKTPEETSFFEDQYSLREYALERAREDAFSV